MSLQQQMVTPKSCKKRLKTPFYFYMYEIVTQEGEIRSFTLGFLGGSIALF
jgi:hypothetical protein